MSPYDSVTTQDTSGAREIYLPSSEDYAGSIQDLLGVGSPYIAGEGQEVIEQSIADDMRRKQAYNRIFLPPPQYRNLRITANTPTAGTLIKSTPGTLHSIYVANAGTAWVVTFSDNNLQLGMVRARYLTAMGLGVFLLDYQFTEAITVTATGDVAGELVVAYL